MKFLEKFRMSQIKETSRISWRLLKLVWEIDKGLLCVTTVATLVPGALPYINFYIYKLIIDLVAASIGGAQFDYQRLYFLIFIRVLTYFAQSIANLTQDLIERLLWMKIPIRLNEMILAKTASLDVAYYENSEFRDLMEKVRDSYSMRPQNLLSYILFSGQSLVQFLIAFITISQLNVYLCLFILLIAVPEFFNQAYMSKLSWGVWSWNSPLRKRFWYLGSLLSEAQFVKEVKLFSLAKRFIAEIKELQVKFYDDNKKVIVKSYKFNLFFGMMSTAIFIGTEVFVVIKAIARERTIGDISFYTGVVMNFQNGLSGLISNITRIFDNSLYVKSIFELLDTQPIIQEPKTPKHLDYSKPPRIEFKKVDFAYPNTERKILDNFSLIIDPGDKIAFVGENGAGKSTIIKLMARFYDVTAGEILINGINIQEIAFEDLYRCFGILFQDFNRYEHTLGENIYFGRVYEKYHFPKIEQAAKDSGAVDVVKRLEKGYEQMLGRTFEGGIELSGGQWQKVALGRAFLRSAPVLVLDEPTAAIDAKAEAQIFEKVEKLSKDKTVIIISHRFSTVRNAEKIFVIDDGEIKEVGSHQQLMKLDGQYAKLFKLQAKGYQ
jgi:ATP-binding cassette subfamily B protein